MRAKNWTDLIKPERFDVRDRGFSATVIVEPLERGYGFTLGDALRRTLLASIPGWAVTAARIAGAAADGTHVEGVVEGQDEIVLNLKEIAIRSTEALHDEPLLLTTKRAGPVTAGQIKLPKGMEVVNPDHIICTLKAGHGFHAELISAPGLGYRAAVMQPRFGLPDGFIPLDSLFSPVRRVSYSVEATRLGQSLDYDRLILHIDTNGTIEVEEAVSLAAGILHDQLRVFINFEEAEVAAPVPAAPDPLGFSPALLQKVEELELSVRASNCLKHENIVYMGDLVTRTEREMLRVPNFGRKSLNEIKLMLANLGLTLGMEIPEWPPEDIETLVKRFGDND